MVRFFIGLVIIFIYAIEVIGIDEAGRGAWAGPLVVAGCYFVDTPPFINELKDSKKLSRLKREQLEGEIKALSQYSVEVVSANQIDRDGLTVSIRKAILSLLRNMPDDVLITLDGTYNFLKDSQYARRTVVEVKADSKYASVMAASILAKVHRDRMMISYDIVYPEFGFSTNVGYGTKHHSVMFEKHGLTPIHRKSFKPMREI